MENINKYHNSKIYKITDIDYNKCYIGSTIERLSQRMSHHRCQYRLWKRGLKNNISSHKLFDEYGVENCIIELIENVNCENREELLRIEGYHIKNTHCVNKCVAGRTDAEYSAEYHEKHKEREQLYRSEHKVDKQRYDKWYRIGKEDEILQRVTKYAKENIEKLTEVFKCECGGKYQYRSKTTHFKSVRHQAYIDTITMPSNNSSQINILSESDGEGTPQTPLSGNLLN